MIAMSMHVVAITFNTFFTARYRAISTVGHDTYEMCDGRKVAKKVAKTRQVQAKSQVLDA